MRRLMIYSFVASILILMPFSAFADFTDGLVLYLPFDEGTGDAAGDISDNGHNGVIDNPDWVDGKFGRALQFGGDGSDTFVTVESTDMLNVNEMTFMAWINAEHWDGVRQIVGKSVHGGCAGRTQYGIFSEGGGFTLRFETEAGRANINSDLPPTGEWVHVTATNDGTTAKIFFNGSEVGTGEVAGTLNMNDDPWRVGQDCDRAQYVFAGIIDDVRLWNRALSEAEIVEFMGEGASIITAIEPQDKLPAAWGKIKAQY